MGNNYSYHILTAPEINIMPVPGIVSSSQHFVPVTRNSCWSSEYDKLLKFENTAGHCDRQKTNPVCDI